MKAIGLLFLVSAASAAVGADYYVAKSGVYVDDKGVSHEAYTSLVTALDYNTSPVRDGDTVWVEDGYVADDASDPVMAPNRYSCQNRLLVRRQITVRSKSGTYDEAKGLGVTVKGAPHSATQPLGEKAIRCLRTEKAGAVYLGFIFDGGCSSSGSYSGGGAYAQVATAFTNCLFRNCHAYQGGGLGGVAGVTCYKCVFTNNVASSLGGGVQDASCEDCLIADNEGSQGGGVAISKNQTMSFKSCRILRNRARLNTTESGGGLLLDKAGSCTVVDCHIANNVAQGSGGGVFGPVVMANTWIVGNSAGHCPPTNAGNYGNGGGVHGGTALTATLTDCHVLSNRSISAINNYASGGGVYNVRAVKTEIAGNIVEGGCAGANASVLVGCTVTDNVATNDLSTTNPSFCGGVGNSTATNCLIAGNVCRMSTGGGWCGGVYNSRLVGCVVSNNMTRGVGGGIAWDSKAAAGNDFAANCVIVSNVCSDVGGGVYSEIAAELYNCLILRNKGDSNVGAGGVSGRSDVDLAPLLVNCTVRENDGNISRNSGVGGVRYVSLLNTIVWNNVGKLPDVIRGFARYSCGTALTDEMGAGNITDDPKLTTEARLKAKSPCRGTGYYNATEMPWAEDPSDPRHLDLAGNGRLNGSTIDRGCYAYVPLSGMVLLVR